VKNKWTKYALVCLVICFLVFTYIIYSSIRFHYSNNYNQLLANQGELVWQKYNCQSCHQMYGLGGYLGPDLTNVMSAKGRNEVNVLAVIRTGSIQMPSFNLSEDEKIDLIEFLKLTDASGQADPRSFESHFTGMISKDGN